MARMGDDSENPGGTENPREGPGSGARQQAWLARVRARPVRNWPWDVAAFLWGLAEGIFFFTAAEVLISYLALSNPVRALRAAGAALVGAVIGIAVLYLWAARDVFSAMTLLSALPGLGPEVMEAAENALMEHGLAAVPAGVLSAATGKAHAVFAAQIGIGLIPFLAVFAIIRLVKLLLVGCVSFCLGAMAQCFLSRRIVLALWAAAWVLIYWRIFWPAV